jgi:hypothetical protein
MSKPKARAGELERQDVILPGVVPKTARKRYTLEETRAQTDAVERMLVLGHTQQRIINQLTQPAPRGLGVSKHRIATILTRVFSRWEEENRASSSKNRQAAELRLLSYIQRCQGRRDPNNPNVWIERPNDSALAKHERLLAEIQGTLAPEEINVNVQITESLAAVFATYTADDLRELSEAAERKHRLAMAYLEEHPEERDMIDVEGAAAE